MLRASIRARCFSQISARVQSWRTPCKKHGGLPYNAFGRALAPAGYLKQFTGTLTGHDEMLKHPPHITKHFPAELSNEQCKAASMVRNKISRIHAGAIQGKANVWIVSAPARVAPPSVNILRAEVFAMGTPLLYAAELFH